MSRPPAGPLFLGILVLGFLILTLANRATLTSQRQDVTVEELTARLRYGVELQQKTSDLVFNLAFGSLAALISLRFSSKTSARLAHPLPVAAAASLGLSLYSRFLFQWNVNDAVIRGPLNLLQGPTTEVPLTAQFWTFMIAVLLLAWWALASRPFLAVLLAGVALGTPAVARGQTPQGPCADQWSRSRGVALSARARDNVVQLALRLRSRAALPAEEGSCLYQFSVLDQLRSEGLAQGTADAALPAWTENTLESLLREANSPTIAPGELLSRLITASVVWRSPSGLVTVTSQIGSIAVMASHTSGSETWRCRTECVVRVPPGLYRLQFLSNGVRVAPDAEVVVPINDSVSYVVRK
jgi:hypothetical protein